MCSIDFTWCVVPSISLRGGRTDGTVCTLYPNSAQMITSAIAVGSDGAIVLGAGATYGIMLAILCCHGLVCSAATNVLARLNLFYVLVNGVF